MAYNEQLADRVREIISLSHKNVVEKAMFGGLCFMVNDKMCVGVEKDRLMVRLDPTKYEEVMEKEGLVSVEPGEDRRTRQVTIRETGTKVL
ncbi:MAG: TfoX/Sxy family protein, partial [Chitinophagaceae bacterium]